jgi:ABC-2 type transport system permease protein
VTQQAASAGRIFDLGYQPYTGPREGRARACKALYSNALKTAFGIGRGNRSKIIPFGLLTMAIIPAAIALGIATLLGESFSPIRYSSYLGYTSLLLLLFSATVAPELLCPDRRNRTLSLYFAHAITRADYVVMKGAALLTAMAVITLVPEAILFLGNALASTDTPQYIRDNAGALPRILVSGTVTAVYLAGISLAAASLTPRRIFAAGGVLALFFISTAAAGAIWEAFKTEPARYMMLVSLSQLPFAATAWVFNVPYESGSLAAQTHLPGVLLFLTALAYAAVGLLIVVWRYARWEP